MSWQSVQLPRNFSQNQNGKLQTVVGFIQLCHSASTAARDIITLRVQHCRVLSVSPGQVQRPNLTKKESGRKEREAVDVVNSGTRSLCGLFFTFTHFTLGSKNSLTQQAAAQFVC